MSPGVTQMLARARRTRGLSQRVLAARLGLSQPHLARLESGRGNPTLQTLDRWATSLQFALDLRPLGSATTHAAGILVQAAQAMTSLDSEEDRFRVFLDAFDRLTEMDDAVLATEARAEPPMIGDVRYDALLAALVEHVTLQRGISSPKWARQPRRVVHGLWWTSPLPSARARAIDTCPASFRVRGVMLDATDLDRA